MGTVLVKLDIVFIILWDDSMQDGSVTIINIFELFKQTALINSGKNCAGSDDCREWGRHLIPLWIIKRQLSKRQNFTKMKFSSFDYDFCLIRCRPLPFHVLLKIFLCFHEVENRNFRLKWINFSVDKSSFHK